MLTAFIQERDASLRWLDTLEDAASGNVCQHSRLGAMSAEQFLANWLWHGCLHLRQVTRLKYGHQAAHYPAGYLSYAGTW